MIYCPDAPLEPPGATPLDDHINTLWDEFERLLSERSALDDKISEVRAELRSLGEDA